MHLKLLKGKHTSNVNVSEKTGICTQTILVQPLSKSVE